MHLKVIKIFIKRFFPSFLPISFTSFYKLSLSLLLFGALSACGNNTDTAPASKTSLAIPTPLQKLATDGGELNAFVVIDGDEANRIPMTLNRSGQGSASVTIPRLSRALHNIVVTYEFTNASGTIVLATASSQSDLTLGSDTVTIDANDYDLDIYDEDKDGENNAQELLVSSLKHRATCSTALQLRSIIDTNKDVLAG